MKSHQRQDSWPSRTGHNVTCNPVLTPNNHNTGLKCDWSEHYVLLWYDIIVKFCPWVKEPLVSNDRIIGDFLHAFSAFFSQCLLSDSYRGCRQPELVSQPSQVHLTGLASVRNNAKRFLCCIVSPWESLAKDDIQSWEISGNATSPTTVCCILLVYVAPAWLHHPSLCLARHFGNKTVEQKTPASLALQKLVPLVCL